CADGHCAAPSCDEDVLNGDERARDCGGSTCDGCGVGAPCKHASDCLSSACDDETHKCVLSCVRGTVECDGDLEEECETNLLTSERNCGACGHVCVLPHADTTCVGGACQIEKCHDPWERCNPDEDDGC